MNGGGGGAGYERPLTRRQRKALGLLKVRPGLGSSGSPGVIEIGLKGRGVWG